MCVCVCVCVSVRFLSFVILKVHLHIYCTKKKQDRSVTISIMLLRQRGKRARGGGSSYPGLWLPRRAGDGGMGVANAGGQRSSRFAYSAVSKSSEKAKKPFYLRKGEKAVLKDKLPISKPTGGVPTSEKAKKPFYQSAGFWVSWFVGGISAYFYRSSTSGEREDKVLNGILAQKAVSRNETREIRSGNYEFTVNEYNKVCKSALECFGSTEGWNSSPKRVTLQEFERFLQLALQHLSPNFGDATKNVDFKERRGMYYKGDYPIGNYYMLERVFQTLESNAKLQEGHRDGTVSLYYLLIALSLAISPAESLVARIMGIFDATIMFTNDNHVPDIAGDGALTMEELEDAVGKIELNANNLPELCRALILTNQIPARRLIRMSKKWAVPEYEMISPVNLTRLLLLDTTDEKLLDQWPLQPPIRVPVGYGDEEPKSFLPGMVDEVQAYFAGDGGKDTTPKRKYPYMPLVVGRPPRLDSERKVNFEEFSCMLRAKKLCAWNSCRTMRATSKAKGSVDQAAPAEKQSADIVEEVKEKQRLMEIMAGIEVEFIPEETFSGAKDGFIFKQGEKGLGYYTDVYDTALRRQQDGNGKN